MILVVFDSTISQNEYADPDLDLDEMDPQTIKKKSTTLKWVSTS